MIILVFQCWDESNNNLWNIPYWKAVSRIDFLVILVCLFGFAPSLSKISIALIFPLFTALYNGVWSRKSTLSKFAPLFISNLNISPLKPTEELMIILLVASSSWKNIISNFLNIPPEVGMIAWCKKYHSLSLISMPLSINDRTALSFPVK